MPEPPVDPREPVEPRERRSEEARPGAGRAVQVGVAALALAVLAGLVLAAQRNDDGADRQAYVAALDDVLTEGGAGPALSGSEAGCLAAATVDAFGLGALQDAVTPDEIRSDPRGWVRTSEVAIDEDLPEQLLDGATGCMDVDELLERRIAAGRGEEVAGCVAGRLDDRLRQALLAQQAGVEITDPGVLDDLAGIGLDCSSG